MTVFVDTGYFLALMLPQDRWHKLAAKISAVDATLVTSSQIIGETITLLQLRGHFSLALDFLQNICNDPDLRIVYPDAPLQSSAWDEFKKSGGLGASAVDCLSFAIMRKSKITKAYTFDRHFATAGFAIISLAN